MIQGIIRDKGGRGTISEATIIILVRNGMVWIMVPVHERDKKQNSKGHAFKYAGWGEN